MSTTSPDWVRLDNAAKIFPAVVRRGWSSMFRLSATLAQPVDPIILQAALEQTAVRFPTMAMRLRRGVFWCYLEKIDRVPKVKEDGPYPCRPMSRAETRECAFRVLYYKNRIAVEFFHALTDGSGGLVFLKTLVAEYLLLKNGVKVPSERGVLDLDARPDEREWEDSFLKNAGEMSAKRWEPQAYHLRAVKEGDGFLNLVTGILKLEEVQTLAEKYGVSVTVILVSAMIAAIIEVQDKDIPLRKKQKPVKIQVPVNLRKFFSSKTLRNFALYINPGIDPRMGDYPFEEIVRSVNFQMGADLTDKGMKARFTTNVRSERNAFVRMMPLFIKNAVMRYCYLKFGEGVCSICISNLGNVKLPSEMTGRVDRMDFVVGPLILNPSNCGVLSYGGNIYINMIRRTREPIIERAFFTTLRRQGLSVKIESNRR